MKARHWTKPDHVTFFIAMLLSIANIFLLRLDLMVVIVVLMLIAFVYDIFEKK